MGRRRSATLWAGETEYQIGIDEDEGGSDPILAVFRNDEEEAIATLHLNPDFNCNYLMRPSERADGHIVVRPEPEED